MTIHSIPRSRTNGHDHGHDGELVETCPLCGNALTGARYRQAMARLERVEKDRMTALETSLKAQFAEQERTAAVKAAAETAAQIEKARREAEQSGDCGGHAQDRRGSCPSGPGRAHEGLRREAGAGTSLKRSASSSARAPTASSANPPKSICMPL